MTEQDTRQKLISAAKSEFLANGYKGASLRRICANAGVTTGALYFFFKGKEDLFGAIVDKPMAQFQKLTAQSIEMELNDPDAYAMIEDSIILPNAWVGRNCRITKAIINEGAVVEDNAVIGDPDGDIQVYGKTNLSI